MVADKIVFLRSQSEMGGIASSIAGARRRGMRRWHFRVGEKIVLRGADQYQYLAICIAVWWHLKASIMKA